MRGENTPERKFASTGYQTHNHQVVSLTCSPLSHPGWASLDLDLSRKHNLTPVTLHSIYYWRFRKSYEQVMVLWINDEDRWWRMEMWAMLSFPKGQVLNSSKLNKQFAGDNYKFEENGRKLSKRVEPTVGKGEIAHYERSFFHSVFKRLVLQTHTNKGLFRQGLTRLNNEADWPFDNAENSLSTKSLCLDQAPFSWAWFIKQLLTFELFYIYIS